MVYKIGRLDSDFVYYGQTDKALTTRLKEHKRALPELEIVTPRFHNTPNIDFDHATVVDKARDYHKRLFLEAWYSHRHRNAGNEHIDIADIYKSLAWFVMSHSAP